MIFGKLKNVIVKTDMDTVMRIVPNGELKFEGAARIQATVEFPGETHAAYGGLSHAKLFEFSVPPKEISIDLNKEGITFLPNFSVRSAIPGMSTSDILELSKLLTEELLKRERTETTCAADEPCDHNCGSCGDCCR